MKKFYYLLAVCAFSFHGYAQPANDDCSNAVALTVNAAGSCANVTAGTLAGATDSGEGDNGSGVPNDDVWFTFVANATSQSINILNVDGDATDIVHEVLEGNCGGGLASIKLTDDPNHSVVTGLVPGSTYYLRVYSYQEDPAESTTFEVCVSDPPPAPANDDCFNPVSLQVNADYNCGNVTAGTLSGATDSGEGDNGTGTPSDDVWYTFVATSSTQKVSLIDVDGDITDLVHEVLEGNCGGGLTSLNVSDNDSSTLNDLTVGNTYIIRVFSYQQDPSTSTTFNICIGTPPPPPANDDCTAAVALTVGTFGNCAATAGTLAGATDSGEGDNGNGNPNDDVWYTFVATAESHIIALSDVEGDPTDLMHEVLEGNCGGGLTSLTLTDPNTSVASGLTVGNTYYVRVFSYQFDPAESTTFNICVSGAASAPANDNCDAAVALTVNPDYLCASNASGTLGGATDSNEGGTGTGTPNDDVWYTFVATETTHRIAVRNVEGDPTDLVHEVLEGNCGGGLTTVNVSDNDTSTVSGLTVGNSYFVRVYSYQDGPAISTTFNICIGTPPPPPANDECSGATEIFVTGTYGGSAVPATISGSTDSVETSNVPESEDCYGFQGSDIWFKAVVPASGSLTIETGPLGEEDGFDSVITAYSGTCDSLTVIDCDDDGADTGVFSFLSLSDLTVGETIYFRVYEYNNDEEEPFTISVYDPSLSATAFDTARFSAYPNPVTDILTLSYTKNISDVQVYNLLGQQVIAKSVNNRQDKLDMSNLPSGTYLVKVTADGQMRTIKVLKN